MPDVHHVAAPIVARGPAAEQLALDDALLEDVSAGGPARVRWWVAEAPTLVVGFAQRARRGEIVDAERCATEGVAVVERRAGGGLVLLDENVLCLSVALSRGYPLWVDDITAAYRWLGDALAAGIRAAGATEARRIEVAEARASAAQLAESSRPATRLVLETCFAALSPHEVVLGRAKVAGVAQVRRQRAALFAAGVLLRPQSRLADLVRVPNEQIRQSLRRDLMERTVGLADRLGRSLDVDDLARTLAQHLPPSVSPLLGEAAKPLLGAPAKPGEESSRALQVEPDR